MARVIDRVSPRTQEKSILKRSLPKHCCILHCVSETLKQGWLWFLPKAALCCANVGEIVFFLEVANTTLNLTLLEGRPTNLLFSFFLLKSFLSPTADTNKLQLPVNIICTQLPALLIATKLSAFRQQSFISTLRC